MSFRDKYLGPIDRFLDRIEPDWLGERDWWSWITHRVFTALIGTLTGFLGVLVGLPFAAGFVGGVWAMTAFYLQHEGSVRNWSWSDHQEKPWVWDGLLDVPLDLALLVTWWAL